MAECPATSLGYTSSMKFQLSPRRKMAIQPGLEWFLIVITAAHT